MGRGLCASPTRSSIHYSLEKSADPNVERRLLTFFVASAVFLSVYMSLQMMFPPPLVDKPASETATSQVAPADLPQEDVTAGSEDLAIGSEQVEGRPVWETLGSMDPADDFFMLVTVCSRGAGIERIELTERLEDGKLKYRRVDVRHGYLGYLAATEAVEGRGVLVRVVGPGTPAALATDRQSGDKGLQPGDHILSIDNREVASVADLERLLESTRPGQKVILTVERSASATGSEASGDDVVQATREIAFEVELTEHPLDLIRLASTAGEDQIVGNESRLSCLLTLAQVGERSIRAGQRELRGLPTQHNAVWTASSEEGVGGAATRSYRLPLAGSNAEGALIREAGNRVDALELVRSYQLAKKSYFLDLGVEIVNRTGADQKLAYRLEGPNEVTLEGWWYSTKISPNYFSGAAARDLVYNTVAASHGLTSGYDLHKYARDNPDDPDEIVFSQDGDEERRQVRYIGIDAQYFLAAFVPGEGKSVIDDFVRGAGTLIADAAAIPRHQERAVNVSFYVDSKVATVADGQSLKNSVRLFAGPKQPDLLASSGLSRTIEYGWFGWVAEPLSWILHGFYAIVGNYAVAIIMLTLLVRGLMFPLSRRAAVHAQKMQELAPELKKIAEKYKDDFEKRLKAQRELQQRVGFNPLSGCLPMFIQLPIFMGLYRALSVDIELRQAAFSSATQWSSNLAGPDMLYYWGDWLWDYLSGRGTGWLGPYFNVLPIIVVVLFLIQQKMFMPPATDEQTAMTQKVMTIMTMMMGLFFFRVPAGLCVYFITSSLWGIAERKLVKKLVPSKPQLALGGTVEGTVASVVQGEQSKSSMADRLMKAVGKEKPVSKPTLPPNKRKRPPGTKK
jgi:YidC/Oxa1 family membrane protein insertase